MALIGEQVIQAHHLLIALYRAILFTLNVLFSLWKYREPAFPRDTEMNSVLMEPLHFNKHIRVNILQPSTTCCNVNIYINIYISHISGTGPCCEAVLHFHNLLKKMFIQLNGSVKIDTTRQIETVN